MSIKLNHTIVAAQDKKESATFLTELFGLPEPQAVRPFPGGERRPTASASTTPRCPTARTSARSTTRSWCPRTSSTPSTARSATRGMQHWADPRGSTAGRDQPQRRRPRRLLPGPGGPLPGDHHPPVRVGRLSRASSRATPSPLGVAASSVGCRVPRRVRRRDLRPPGHDRRGANRCRSPATEGPRSCGSGHEGIGYGHLSIQHRGERIGRDRRVRAEREDNVELIRDVITEKSPSRRATTPDQLLGVGRRACVVAGVWNWLETLKRVAKEGPEELSVVVASSRVRLIDRPAAGR